VVEENNRRMLKGNIERRKMGRRKK